jgi:pyruvate,water dikinase
MTGPSIGRLPEDLEIPIIPFSLGYTLTHIIPNAVRTELKQSRYRKTLGEFLETTPQWCETMQQRIRQARAGDELVVLWQEELEPYQVDALWATKAAGSLYVDIEPRLRGRLAKLVGEIDASILLSSTSSRLEMLESVGPMAGLSRVARGAMSREEYLLRYGHRGPHEMELSIPRPIEDPDWLDRQLDECRKSSRNVGDLLAKRRTGFETAWQRLQDRYPRKARSLRKKIDALEEAARRREAIRSEGVRVLGVARAFALRVGQLTGAGDDVFFLAIDELLDLLSGQDSVLDQIPARRETHARYRALPPLPGLVRGRFDPFQWAADPNRRSDLYEARAGAPEPPSQASTVTGSAGSPGRVEGVVRRLDAPEEGDRLRDGEILVTAQTNVGWTLLFPRAAAVVTDVGAPLSHAAIVARELGIPAVVGCGNATTRLRTGDRVRVDGGRGTVEIVHSLS